MSEKVFHLPDLGEGLTEAEVVRWLVSEGDAVAIDQPVAELETAKAVVEVPSPFAGTVARRHGAAGEVLDVGAPLLTVRATEAQSTEPAGAPEETAELDAAEGYRAEERAGSGQVLIGYGTPEASAVSRRSRPARQATVKAGRAPEPLLAETSPGAAWAPRVISPIVRQLARESGVDLRTLVGSGPDGLILRSDVQAAVVGDRASEDSRSGLPVLSRTSLSGTRRTIAEQLSRSRREIPEATVWVDADATALCQLRAGLKAETGSAPSLLAFIARFALAGLAEFPELNSRIEADQIFRVEGVNLGFAAQTQRGLVVPTVRSAHQLSARDLDAEIRRLTGLAREGKIAPAELNRGTFTINNYGVFGVDGSAAIINYPESAILGVGRVFERPWVVSGKLAVRQVVELTLAFDHRVCDGGAAGGFLRYIADAVENPGRVLADL